MSRLSKKEFQAMNSLPRRLLQKYYEFPRLKSMGVRFAGKDILEIGCGSGYGALLMTRDKPRSYIGIDVMEEQIELARKREIPDAEFRIEDATQLCSIADASKNLVVIYGMAYCTIFLNGAAFYRNVIEFLGQKEKSTSKNLLGNC